MERLIDCPNPDCNDKGRHCSVNTTHGLWHCVKCNSGGSLLIPGFNEYHQKVCEQVIFLEDFAPQLHWLINRYKLSIEIIKAYRIGFDTKLFRWPFFNTAGELIGTHRQNPNPGEKDWRWRISYQSNQSLWPNDWDQIKVGEEVIICEGLGDCLLLRQLNLKAFTSTGGASTFPETWTSAFVGIKTTLFMDNDRAGEDASHRIGTYLVKSGAAEINIIDWPETAPEKCDVQKLTELFPIDYANRIKALIANAVDYQARIIDLLPEIVQIELPLLSDIDIAEILPSSGFFREYYAVARACTDAPDAFLIFPSIIAVSSVVGRRVMIPYAQGIYLNLYLMLLAASTWQRKSTALDILRDIIIKVGRESEENPTDPSTIADVLGTKIPQYPTLLYPHDITPEALYARMQRQPEGIMILAEMGTQIVKWRKDYQADMPYIMNELYDCPIQWERETRKDTFLIREPYLCIAGACVLDWFRRTFNYEYVASGWLPRWLTIATMQPTSFKAWPELISYEGTIQLSKKLRSLRDSLPSRSEVSPLHIDGHLIQDDYIRWAKSIKDESEKRHIGPLAPISAVWGRSLQVVLKIAACIQLAETGSHIISEETWDRSRRLVEYALLSSELVLSKQAVDKGMTTESWVLRRVRAKPGIKISELNKGPDSQRHGGSEGIRRALAGLIEKGFIKEEQDEKGTSIYFYAREDS